LTNLFKKITHKRKTGENWAKCSDEMGNGDEGSNVERAVGEREVEGRFVGRVGRGMVQRRTLGEA
jgi:hypothetical protein